MLVVLHENIYIIFYEDKYMLKHVYTYYIIVESTKDEIKTGFGTSYIIDGNLARENRKTTNGSNMFISSVARKLSRKVPSSKPKPSKPKTTEIGNGAVEFRNFLKGKTVVNSISSRQS